MRDVTLTDSSITGNEAFDGGGVNASRTGTDNADVAMVRSSIWGNVARRRGRGDRRQPHRDRLDHRRQRGQRRRSLDGGWWLLPFTQLVRSTVSGNRAAGGGGVAVPGWRCRLDRSVVAGNPMSPTSCAGTSSGPRLQRDRRLLRQPRRHHGRRRRRCGDVNGLPERRHDGVGVAGAGQPGHRPHPRRLLHGHHRPAARAPARWLGLRRRRRRGAARAATSSATWPPCRPFFDEIEWMADAGDLHRLPARPAPTSRAPPVTRAGDERLHVPPRRLPAFADPPTPDLRRRARQPPVLHRDRVDGRRGHHHRHPGAGPSPSTSPARRSAARP